MILWLALTVWAVLFLFMYLSSKNERTWRFYKRHKDGVDVAYMFALAIALTCIILRIIITAIAPVKEIEDKNRQAMLEYKVAMMGTNHSFQDAIGLNNNGILNEIEKYNEHVLTMQRVTTSPWIGNLFPNYYLELNTVSYQNINFEWPDYGIDFDSEVEIAD